MARTPYQLSIALGVALTAAVASATGCNQFSGRADHGDASSRIVSVSKQINEYIYAIGAERNIATVDSAQLLLARLGEKFHRQRTAVVFIFGGSTARAVAEGSRDRGAHARADLEPLRPPRAQISLPRRAHDEPRHPLPAPPAGRGARCSTGTVP